MFWSLVLVGSIQAIQNMDALQFCRLIINFLKRFKCVPIVFLNASSLNACKTLHFWIYRCLFKKLMMIPECSCSELLGNISAMAGTTWRLVHFNKLLLMENVRSMFCKKYRSSSNSECWSSEFISIVWRCIHKFKSARFWAQSMNVGSEEHLRHGCFLKQLI